MSLLQKLSYEEYKYACDLTKDACARIAKEANLKFNYDGKKKPGEQLIKLLDRRGYTVQQYRNLATSALNKRTTYYNPQSKVAILIANDKYECLSKLITPVVDCESISANLKELGFLVLIIKNTFAEDLRNILFAVFASIPENSYCFIFYAGHGCELCNTKCILNIDCPKNGIEIDHCVTENWILREVGKCKPELCVMIMDMCRMALDRNTNLSIFAAVPFIEDYTINGNLLIGYSTGTSQAAYEVLQIECSNTIDICATYELKTGDSKRIIPVGSQYVSALCNRLNENEDISTILDRVHTDVENSFKKQRPIKVQCGTAKRSLHDVAIGDIQEVYRKLEEAIERYKECCTLKPL